MLKVTKFFQIHSAYFKRLYLSGFKSVFDKLYTVGKLIPNHIKYDPIRLLEAPEKPLVLSAAFYCLRPKLNNL